MVAVELSDDEVFMIAETLFRARYDAEGRVASRVINPAFVALERRFADAAAKLK